ncbi:endonuclease domain-containing protein [Naasia lichenicola]|uniref:DUF559 domain-containing protein n=1 Tax=Naasia lichenicola TaxID=2565933 RepID=A0A4S4FSZ1_9MICO|nr:DUF559 domain-containing protein [Naasia lichenicola]THG33431.1 DUF559 domain-containing protein [Naasia lichenicola]
MPNAKPLPPDLVDSTFTTSRALGRGASPTRMRARDLHREVWGVRSRQPPQTLLDSCRLYLERLPRQAFVSHATAALLHGIPLPPRIAFADDVDVALPRPERAPHARGIRGHSLDLAPGERILVGDVPVTSPIRTWFDLGKVLAIHDLVAAGDFLLTDGPERDELVDYVRMRRGQRGSARLATACQLLNSRSESPQESRLRALLMLAGMDELTVNDDILDRNGRFLARADLVVRSARLIIEYQGDHHRDPAQWHMDLTRRSKLEAEGWTVVEVGARDLDDPIELAGRLRDIVRARV